MEVYRIQLSFQLPVGHFMLFVIHNLVNMFVISDKLNTRRFCLAQLFEHMLLG